MSSASTPPMQRRGLGTAVLDQFTARARAAGVSLQRISVEPWNTRSLAFFRGHGFTDRGRGTSDPAWGAAGGVGRAQRAI